MKQLHKIILALCIGLGLIFLISATQLTTTYNPFTGKLDYISVEVELDPLAYNGTLALTSSLDNYRLQSWNNLTGIPHATPSNGDVTHFSLADEIYDWVVGLGYALDSKVDSIGNWTSDKVNYVTWTNLWTTTYNETEVNNLLAGQDACSEITGCIENAITEVVSDTTPTLGGNLDANNKNITNINMSTFCNGANCWTMYVNSSDYFIIEAI